MISLTHRQISDNLLDRCLNAVHLKIMSAPSYTSDRTLERTNIDAETQEKIIELASNGMNIEKLCQSVGLSWNTIARYCIKDPLFDAEWKRARTIGADLVADKLETAYDNAETVADAMIARGKSDNYRTLAGWRNPKAYGPKLNVDVVHSIDLSSALQQAEKRTIPILEQAQIDRIAAAQSPDSTLPIGIPAHRVDHAEVLAKAKHRSEAERPIVDAEIVEDDGFSRYL
jgi:hypothetical protein